MATYIKFLAGDYGKEEYIYIKNKNQLRCSSKMFGAKELFLSSIASCARGKTDAHSEFVRT